MAIILNSAKYRMLFSGKSASALIRGRSYSLICYDWPCASSAAHSAFGTLCGSKLIAGYPQEAAKGN